MNNRSSSKKYCLDSTVSDLHERISKLEKEINLRDVNLYKQIRSDYMYWIKILLFRERILHDEKHLKTVKEKINQIVFNHKTKKEA